MKILLTVIIIMVSNLIIKTNLKSDKLLINQSFRKDDGLRCLHLAAFRQGQRGQKGILNQDPW